MTATPTVHGRYPTNTSQGAEFGAGAPTYAGNAAIGSYYVVDGNQTQQIVRLSPTAPREHNVATVHAPRPVTVYDSPPPAVALGRSFYFLDPPTLSYPGGNSAPVVDGAAALYRVTPRSPGDRPRAHGASSRRQARRRIKTRAIAGPALDGGGGAQRGRHQSLSIA